MIFWFHSYIPQPILLQWGWLSIHWYGLILAIAMVVGFFLTSRLAKLKGYKVNDWQNMLFYALLGGLLGARLYHVCLELPYYLIHPLEIVQIWQGGLAIHGAIIGGGLAVYFFSKKYKWQYGRVLDILVLAMILGQALGRWGNFFNQELFGVPTEAAWGIFIEVINRPIEFIQFSYFHPTFLYEFLANLILFFILLVIYKRKNDLVGLIASLYLIGYSIIRFCLEFIRIDRTPEVLGLRWPQWASIFIVLAVCIYWFIRKGLQNSNKPV